MNNTSSQSVQHQPANSSSVTSNSSYYQQQQSYSEPTRDTQSNLSFAQYSQSTVPDQYTRSGNDPVTTGSGTTSTALQTQTDPAAKESFIQKSTTWVKANPGKTLLIAGGIVASGYLLMKTMRSSNGDTNTNGLNGIQPKPRNNYYKRRRKKNQQGKQKVKRQILL